MTTENMATACNMLETAHITVAKGESWYVGHAIKCDNLSESCLLAGGLAHIRTAPDLDDDAVNIEWLGPQHEEEDNHEYMCQIAVNNKYVTLVNTHIPVQTYVDRNWW